MLEPLLDSDRLTASLLLVTLQDTLGLKLLPYTRA